MDKWQIYNNFRSVESDLIVLLRYVELNEQNHKTNSAEIRKLILTSCSYSEHIYYILLDKFKMPDKRSSNESIASKIYNITCKNKYPLSNITACIQSKSFNPWSPTATNEINEHTFSWWNAYNACKHVKLNEDIAFFKSAIESVAALFCLTIFLTSETKINVLWHQSDPIKIQVTGVTKPLSYNRERSLKEIFWPR